MFKTMFKSALETLKEKTNAYLVESFFSVKEGSHETKMETAIASLYGALSERDKASYKTFILEKQKLINSQYGEVLNAQWANAKKQALVGGMLGFLGVIMFDIFTTEQDPYFSYAVLNWIGNILRAGFYTLGGAVTGGMLGFFDKSVIPASYQEQGKFRELPHMAARVDSLVKTLRLTAAPAASGLRATM